MKTYTISESAEADDQKTITITEVETKETTVVEKITVAQLKEQYTSILEQITSQKIKANEIVDELIAIDADAGINITIKDIPTKL